MISRINKIKIHYLSDIHLEYYDLTKIPRLLQQIVPQSPICVLAGDIGYVFQKSYESFLRGIHSKFDHIFLIHGNHEYYQLKENLGHTNEEILQKTKNIISTHDLHKIHFLHNTHYDLPNSPFRFIGSVLWSNIEDNRYLSNDFHMIHKYGIDDDSSLQESLLPSGDLRSHKKVEINKEHQLCKDYIKSALIQATHEDKRVIMITHFLPSFKLNHPKYAKYINYHQCFSSHCDDLIKEPIQAWIFGHTHMDIHMKINDVLCVANPIGYKGEKLDPKFNAFITI